MYNATYNNGWQGLMREGEKQMMAFNLLCLGENVLKTVMEYVSNIII